jgi:DNA-binding transcriptional regulator YhcF (GntR family)
MRLWFSRGSEISIRDQLATQVILSILSGELRPGQRLPSTRELARRFRLHPNTISAGYRHLEQNGWVEFRKGSGIYVRKKKLEDSAVALDQLIAQFSHSVREIGLPLAVVRARLRQWLELQPPERFVLIEPDSALARIVTAEMHKALDLPVSSCGLERHELAMAMIDSIPVCLSMKENAVRPLLPENAELLTLNLRSVGDSLAPYLPAPATALIGVASGWPTFLTTARTILIAAGFDADCLLLRDASQPNWQRGLKQASAVVCDTLTAQSLDGTCHIVTFPLVAESSLQELRAYEEFVRNPLGS